MVGYGNADTQFQGPFCDGVDRIVSIRVFGMKMQIDHCILFRQFIEIGPFKQNFVGIAAAHNLLKKIKSGWMQDRIYLSWGLGDGTRRSAGYQLKF